MSTLVIASGADDYKYLRDNDLLPDIRKAFKADNVTWCNTAECLTHLSQQVDAILFFDSFKQLKYDQVRAMAAASLTVDKVYGVQLKNNKLWVYEDGIIIDCIAKNGIAEAIGDSIALANRIMHVGDAVMAIIVALIFAFLLLSYFNVTGHQSKVYANPQNQEVQQIEQTE